MELQKVIETRRSVRKYDASRKVTKEQISEIVQAAIQAPSWKNSQTARYHVVLSDELTKTMLNDCLPEFNAKNSEGAALVVTTFVANREGFNREGQPDNEVGNGWGFYDLGLHNENFVLKAKEIGLDTLIMGIRDEKKIREVLQIPDAETIVAVIALGYGEQEPEMPKRKKPEDIVTYY